MIIIQQIVMHLIVYFYFFIRVYELPGTNRNAESDKDQDSLTVGS